MNVKIRIEERPDHQVNLLVQGLPRAIGAGFKRSHDAYQALGLLESVLGVLGHTVTTERVEL